MTKEYLDLSIAGYQRAGPGSRLNIAEHGDGLTAHCERRTCLHAAQLDVAALIVKLGPETTVPELGQRMRCTKCGGRDIAFTRHPRPRAPQL